MPHACRLCFCKRTTENVSIFVENRLPRSLCQSQTHTMSPWTGSKRNREIIAFFKKLRSLVTCGSSSLGDRPQIDKNHLQAQHCRAKSPNRNREIVHFSPKSSGFIQSRLPMSLALTDQPKNDKNGIIHIRLRAFESPLA